MPGATTKPSASMVSRASSVTSPTATMRPSRMPTSARRPGAPVPSTTVPALITQSSIPQSYEPAWISGPRGLKVTPVRNPAGSFRGALRGVQGLAPAGLGRRLGLALAGCGFLALRLVGLALLQHLGAGLVGLGLARRAGDEAEGRQV